MTIELDKITFIRAEAFGAKGDGKTDDRPAIQEAIDYALQNKIREVKLGDGLFKIGDTLHLGYGAGTSTVSLTGTGIKYRAEAGFGGTAIFADFNDRPAIAIQGGYYSEVKGITVKGLNQTPYRFNTYNSTDKTPTKQAELMTDPNNWIDPSLPKSADSQHAPYAAIAIDPYSGSRPADSYPDVMYPAWTGIHTQYNNQTFSSGVAIENVWIQGFMVGIVSQPCDADGNGDFLKIHRCKFEALKYGISIGNVNSRNVSIRDCEYDFLYTFLTNRIHGRQIGQFGGPIDNISGTRSLSNVNYFWLFPTFGDLTP
jgi:hypothetical protein